MTALPLLLFSLFFFFLMTFESHLFYEVLFSCSPVTLLWILRVFRNFKDLGFVLFTWNQSLHFHLSLICHGRFRSKNDLINALLKRNMSTVPEKSYHLVTVFCPPSASLHVSTTPQDFTYFVLPLLHKCAVTKYRVAQDQYCTGNKMKRLCQTGIDSRTMRNVTCRDWD